MKGIVRYILLLAVVGIVSCNYAGTLILNASTFNKTMTKTVPHIPDSDLIAVIRDIDSVSRFTWNMTYDVVRGSGPTDTVVFNFPYDWPTTQLTSLTIDYLLLRKNPGIRPYRQCITSFQTHLQLSYLSPNKTYYCFLFPVGFSNFQLTSGFTYMAVLDPNYKMFAIHYMHMNHHGSHDQSKVDFDDKGEWVTFQYVVIEKESLSTPEGCAILDRNQVKKYQNFWTREEGCEYFGGIKFSPKYRTKGQFYINSSVVAFRDYLGSDFGIAAFPFEKAGFTDERVFELVPQKQDESFYSTASPKQQDYWFVVYILGTGILISLALLLYANFALRRNAAQRTGDRKKLVVHKSPQTLEITSHNVPCSNCGKQVEMISQISLQEKAHVVCDSCRVEDFSD